MGVWVTAASRPSQKAVLYLSMFSLVFGLVAAQTVSQQPSNTLLPRRSSSALFIDDSAVTAASISPRNFKVNEQIVTVARAGGQRIPVMKVVDINNDLLARAPRRIPLNPPDGATITAVRRPDHDRLARTAMAAPMTPKPAQQQQQEGGSTATSGGGAAIWVGEVVGARGGLSSVVLVSAESGGLYGNVRYYDRKADSIKAFTIYPMLLEGVDPVAAAAMPDFKPTATSDGPQVTLADLYPARHPTKHIVAQYEEHKPSPLSPEEEQRVIYTGPPDTANANPATVITANPDDPITVLLLLTPPANVTALAEAIAAGAGPDIAAELGSEGFMAVASSWIERAQAAATAPAAALASAHDDSATDGSTAGSGSTVHAAADAVPGASGEGGRKLKQTVVFNERQDILMLWTSSAASAAGGADRIQAAMRTAIVNTNKIYADSRASIDLILVGLQATSHSDNTVSSSNLNKMNSGSVQGLTAAREGLGADFVQMWTGSTTSTCGIGYVPGSMTNPPPLMSIVNSRCFDGLTVAHEIGHNQGCFHSAKDTGSIADYAAGYKVCGSSSRFHTVMAYPCESGSAGTRIAFLSNPSINRPGTSTPIGTAGTGHCARRVSETAQRCGGVRAEKFPSASGNIRSALSATKCVDAVKYVLGTQVAINDCVTAGRSYQRWEVVPDGSLRSPNTARCIQAASTLTNGVSSVQVWECTAGSVAQQWFYDSLTRLHPYSAPSRCLTLPNSNTNRGQGLTVEECSATANNQRWTTSTALFFPPAFNPQNSRLQSRLANPAQCIENLGYNTTNGAPGAMMPCNENATTNTNQRWRLTDTGLLQLTFNTAKCLEAGGAGANGDPIRLSDCTGSNSQRWFMDASSRLRPYHAPAKCMDIRNGALVTPAVLQLFDCLEANQQKWTVLV